MPNEVPALGTWSHTSFFAVRGAAVDGNGTPAAAQRSATVRVSVLGARGVAAMFAHGVASRGVSAGGREWEAASGGMQASAKRYAEKFGSDFIL